MHRVEPTLWGWHCLEDSTRETQQLLDGGKGTGQVVVLWKHSTRRSVSTTR